MSLVSSTTANGGGGSSTELKFKERSTHKALRNLKKEDIAIKTLGKEQNPTEVVNNLNVNPHVTNICKQKLCIDEEGKSKYEKNKFLIDLKQSLLSWFELQLSNEIPVDEEHMRVKAEEIASSLNNKKFKCTDIWLLDFRITNNIIAYRSTASTDKSGQLLIDWLKKYDKEIDNNNIYIGGTCGLWHSMDLDRYSKAISQQQFLEYINLMSLAWHCMYDIPIKVEDNSILDRYVYCDEDLQSICPDFRDVTVPFTPNVLHMLDGSTDPKSPMAIEVFQAMKKLVRYLQSESAPTTSIESAKILEDNLEYGALLEIQQKIQNDNIIENTD
ncbi:hypothetical protein EVAR_60314_1 [Eumeta japonica]|uniref:HTH CENPB-type domain-containing protein n=1 Tax=Eumeta variegata TaxID=151549 RepID=A0A4C1ZB58_EUMVA|nr:hypothetical protein EVAR_60314_1 [Eumeta japonica]